MTAQRSPSDLGRIGATILAVSACWCALLAGCANPIANANRIAVDFGYERLRLNGDGFEHIAYYKPGDGGKALHVYIEHDGTPWATPTTPATDPTPRNPLMLELMSIDPAPALYLGRPCYFGTAVAPPCEPIWWTHRRFSRDVIRSMDAALGAFLATRREFQAIEFYGYSGGGVIAVLMAADFPQTRRVVTIAAPLDLDAWVRVHEYSPLEGSISPMQELPLSPDIRQLHLAGADDKVVGGELIKPFVARQPAAAFREIPGFDHYCCWISVWAGTGLRQ